MTSLETVRAELVSTLQRAPSDEGARMYLFQLLCVVGEWDKAAKQLRMLAGVSSEARMLETVYGRAIEAEKTRGAALAGAGDIPIHGEGAPWLDDLVASIRAFGAGDAATGEARRDAAFDAALDTPGDADGEPFEWVADADSRFGPTLEAIVNGAWGLIPFASLESIAFEGPRDMRDLVWLPAQCRFRSGASIAVLVPTRYPGSEAADEDARMARATRWEESAWGDRGIGQRTLSFGGRDDAGILSLKRLSFT